MKYFIGFLFLLPFYSSCATKKNIYHNESLTPYTNAQKAIDQENKCEDIPDHTFYKNACLTNDDYCKVANCSNDERNCYMEGKIWSENSCLTKESACTQKGSVWTGTLCKSKSSICLANPLNIWDESTVSCHEKDFVTICEDILSDIPPIITNAKYTFTVLNTYFNTTSCRELEDKLASTKEVILNNSSSIESQKIQFIEFIGLFQNIERLELANNRVTSLGRILQLQNLKYLDVSSNKLTAFQATDALKNLTHLNLSFNGITYLKDLKYLVNLEDLLLTNLPLTDDFADFPLPKPSILKKLYLNGTNISSDKKKVIRAKFSHADLGSVK